tara:strand:+ start:2031 stop:2159 length:129 start_codon:yes stop_codon:yes gene_type:complete
MKFLIFYLIALLAIIPLIGHISNIDQTQSQKQTQLIQSYLNQ